MIIVTVMMSVGWCFVCVLLPENVASYFVWQVENADNFKNKIILNEHRLCASSITLKLQNDQLGTVLHCACMYTCI